ISRKAAKIQDVSLTMKSTTFLNDGINKPIQDRRHWASQIVAWWVTNYRRNVAMLDDDDKEVSGTRGSKYMSFGRPKGLPGVQELFTSRNEERDKNNRVLAFYKKFMAQ
ncbi:Isy1-like splicing factor, partial [Mycena haematopus]